MAQINPHINFNGNAEEAFNFYKSVFGGAFENILRFKDIASLQFSVAEEDANKLMHIELPIGKTKLMGNDVPTFIGTVNENENRSKIFVTIDNSKEAYHVFNLLSDSGSVEVPMEVSPAGNYFGMLRDKYGIEWIIDFSPAP